MTDDAEHKESARRENPRARCNFKARCVTVAKKSFEGKVTNISIGGAQVQIPAKLEPTHKLYLEINYYHSGVKSVIKVVGEAVHAHLIASAQAYDVGLKFVTKLTDAEVKLIKKYVKDVLMK